MAVPFVLMARGCALSQGDLSQWVSVLDIVDAELGREESSSELKVACLKLTRQLLENCSNRHVYNTYEVPTSNVM